MSSDDSRQWDKIDQLCRDMTDVKVSIARVEERLNAIQPSAVGSPINLTQAFQNSIASKQGIMSIVIAAITGALSSFFGAKVGS